MKFIYLLLCDGTRLWFIALFRSFMSLRAKKENGVYFFLKLLPIILLIYKLTIHLRDGVLWMHENTFDFGELISSFINKSVCTRMVYVRVLQINHLILRLILHLNLGYTSNVSVAFLLSASHNLILSSNIFDLRLSKARIKSTQQTIL